MTRLFTNNAATTLDGAITAVATSITVTDGSQFKIPTGGDIETATLFDGGAIEGSTNVEIIHITARAANVLTVVRAQEGTTGFAFADLDGITTTVTADDLLKFQTDIRRKNVVIGGDFQTNPWQRGTSFAAPTTGDYTADRFSWDFVGAGIVTVQKTADAPTVVQAEIFTENCLEIDVTTADASIAATDKYHLDYKIEGYDWAKVAQRPFKISFWHKHTKIGIHSVSFRNSGDDRAYVAEYSQAVTDTWEKATVTVAASPSAGTWDYENGVGVTISFGLAYGSNFHTATLDTWNSDALFGSSNQVNDLDAGTNFFRLALIQVESGGVATEFEARSFAEEMALAQRYYWKSFPQGTTPAQSAGSSGAGLITAVSNGRFSISVPYAVLMRSSPTVATFNTSAANTSARNINDSTDTAVFVAAESDDRHAVIAPSALDATDANDFMEVHITANAEL